MALPPQKFREMVFQLLYSYDMGYCEEKDIIELIMHELEVSKKNVLIAHNRVQSIQERQKEIDESISKTVLSYDFERIQSVERNILRLGVYELLFDKALPPVVAIAEGVRLAKKFGSPESASFVNAILDAIYKSSIGEPVDLSHLQKTAEALEKKELEVDSLRQETLAEQEKNESCEE